MTEDAIYVMIPTASRESLLERTLLSLGRCDFPASYRNTIVIENGPVSGAKDIVKAVSQKYPSLCLQYMHTLCANKSTALNLALETISGGLIVFLDDDVRVTPHLLKAYAAAACGLKEGFYFGGPVAVDYEVKPKPWLTPLLPHSARGYDLDHRGTMADEYLGFNWAAFASDLRRAGGFDPMFGPGSPTGATGQETDMQRRLRAMGVKPQDVHVALVWHYVPRTRCSPVWMLRRSYRMGLARGQVRGPERWTRAALKVGRSMGSVLKRAVMRDRSGVFAALCGLCTSVGSLRGRVSFETSSLGQQDQELLHNQL